MQTSSVEIIYAHLKMKHRQAKVEPANLIINVTLERLVVRKFASHSGFRGKLALEEHAQMMINVQECFNAIHRLVNVQNVKYSQENHVQKLQIATTQLLLEMFAEITFVQSLNQRWKARYVTMIMNVMKDFFAWMDFVKVLQVLMTTIFAIQMKTAKLD